MQIVVKTFSELSIDELYEVLQLRSAVFVVEQDCVYQDLDGKDQKALHVLGLKKGEVVAYTRLFAAGDYFEKASIGRVVVKQNYRAFGYGKEILQASVQAIREKFKTETMALSAQTYLKKFYKDLGFVARGAEYLEDGIPHIKMVRG
ncbi:MAG: GNAT family N-acetyltransferase [Flavobacteriaceae bacterium]